MASGLGPEGCTTDPPKTQLDFLNACSTSKCVAFNNCDRLGLCSPSTALPPTQDPINQSIPPLVNPVTAPTNLCTDGAPGGRVIWLFGSADFGPLLRAAQPSLSHPADGGMPYRAVFQGNTSCAGVNSVFDPAKRIMRDPPTETQGGWAFYFDDNGNQVNCRIDPVGTTQPTPGVPVDIGISNLYSQTCSPSLVPGATVAEYTGPVTPFVLSVPSTSSETSISVEAAHFVFGLGGKAPLGSGMKDAAPWTDPTNYSIRNSNSGSTVLTALLVDVPRQKFWGVDRLSTENLRDSLLASTSSNSSIGILSIDFNDKNRGNLKALYLQSRGQLCGYLPDSAPTTYDKLNVRDGHYPLWGYVHFFTPLGPGGVPSPAANAMVLLFRVQKIEQRLLDEIIAASLTPQCAMKVERTSEVGDFSNRTGLSCGCYFDFKTKGHTDCQACLSSEDCPGQTDCNYGYCEHAGI
ncbi:MAG TPA: hypothetical protein VFT22_12125 [Kofleriaceae bacterium]|nr:hypothetical protein [Kofleriaceae bacterium]